MATAADIYTADTGQKLDPATILPDARPLLFADRPDLNNLGPQDRAGLVQTIKAKLGDMRDNWAYGVSNTQSLGLVADPKAHTLTDPNTKAFRQYDPQSNSWGPWQPGVSKAQAETAAAGGPAKQALIGAGAAYERAGLAPGQFHRLLSLKRAGSEPLPEEPPPTTAAKIGETAGGLATFAGKMAVAQGVGAGPVLASMAAAGTEPGSGKERLVGGLATGITTGAVGGWGGRLAKAVAPRAGRLAAAATGNLVAATGFGAVQPLLHRGMMNATGGEQEPATDWSQVPKDVAQQFVIGALLHGGGMLTDQANRIPMPTKLKGALLTPLRMPGSRSAPTPNAAPPTAPPNISPQTVQTMREQAGLSPPEPPKEVTKSGLEPRPSTAVPAIENLSSQANGTATIFPTVAAHAQTLENMGQLADYAQKFIGEEPMRRIAELASSHDASAKLNALDRLTQREYFTRALVRTLRATTADPLATPIGVDQVNHAAVVAAEQTAGAIQLDATMRRPPFPAAMSDREQKFQSEQGRKATDALQAWVRSQRERTFAIKLDDGTQIGNARLTAAMVYPWSRASVRVVVTDATTGKMVPLQFRDLRDLSAHLDLPSRHDVLYPSASKKDAVRIDEMHSKHLLNAEARLKKGPLKDALRREIVMRGLERLPGKGVSPAKEKVGATGEPARAPGKPAVPTEGAAQAPTPKEAAEQVAPPSKEAGGQPEPVAAPAPAANPIEKFSYAFQLQDASGHAGTAIEDLPGHLHPDAIDRHMGRLINGYEQAVADKERIEQAIREAEAKGQMAPTTKVGELKPVADALRVILKLGEDNFNKLSALNLKYSPTIVAERLKNAADPGLELQAIGREINEALGPHTDAEHMPLVPPGMFEGASSAPFLIGRALYRLMVKDIPENLRRYFAGQPRDDFATTVTDERGNLLARSSPNAFVRDDYGSYGVARTLSNIPWAGALVGGDVYLPAPILADRMRAQGEYDRIWNKAIQPLTVLLHDPEVAKYLKMYHAGEFELRRALEGKPNKLPAKVQPMLAIVRGVLDQMYEGEMSMRRARGEAEADLPKREPGYFPHTVLGAAPPVFMDAVRGIFKQPHMTDADIQDLWIRFHIQRQEGAQAPMDQGFWSPFLQRASAHAYFMSHLDHLSMVAKWLTNAENLNSPRADIVREHYMKWFHADRSDTYLNKFIRARLFLKSRAGFMEVSPELAAQMVGADHRNKEDDRFWYNPPPDAQGVSLRTQVPRFVYVPEGREAHLPHGWQVVQRLPGRGVLWGGIQGQPFTGDGPEMKPIFQKLQRTLGGVAGLAGITFDPLTKAEDRYMSALNKGNYTPEKLADLLGKVVAARSQLAALDARPEQVLAHMFGSKMAFGVLSRNPGPAIKHLTAILHHAYPELGALPILKGVSEYAQQMKLDARVQHIDQMVRKGTITYQDGQNLKRGLQAPGSYFVAKGLGPHFFEASNLRQQLQQGLPIHLGTSQTFTDVARDPMGMLHAAVGLQRGMIALSAIADAARRGLPMGAAAKMYSMTDEGIDQALRDIALEGRRPGTAAFHAAQTLTQTMFHWNDISQPMWMSNPAARNMLFGVTTVPVNRAYKYLLRPMEATARVGVAAGRAVLGMPARRVGMGYGQAPPPGNFLTAALEAQGANYAHRHDAAAGLRMIVAMGVAAGVGRALNLPLNTAAAPFAPVALALLAATTGKKEWERVLAEANQETEYANIASEPKGETAQAVKGRPGMAVLAKSGQATWESYLGPGPKTLVDRLGDPVGAVHDMSLLMLVEGLPEWRRIVRANPEVFDHLPGVYHLLGIKTKFVGLSPFQRVKETFSLLRPEEQAQHRRRVAR